MPNITLNAMKEISKNKNTEVEFTYGETVIKINTKLSLNEKSTFIDRVVTSCFIGDDFQPEYVDLMTFATLLQMNSNVNIPKTRDDYLDLNTLYDWMVGTKLIDKIHQFGYEADDISNERDLYNWFADLEQCISDKIEFKKQQILSQKQSPMDELFTTINNLVSSLGDNFKGVDIQSLVTSLSSIKNIDEKSLLDAMINNGVLKSHYDDITMSENEEPKAEISE